MHIISRFAHAFIFTLLISNCFFAKAQLNTNVSIVRDTFGVPHIYGKTDADVVYALAYAHCEDDFKNIQKVLAISYQQLGLIEGKKGAAVDYYNQLLRVDKTVDESYETQLTLKFRLLLDNYAAGINAYAAHHKNEIILKSIFPITGRNVIKACYTLLSGMVGTDDALKACINNTTDSFMYNADKGANLFALAANRSTDGSTMLAINTQGPLEGMISWWEAHISSEEGWNFHGAFFPLMIAPAMGAGDKLGWGVTFNCTNCVNIYCMELNPKNKNEYKFDGAYIPFERSIAKLKVKLGIGKIALKKETLWCKYGPAIRTKHGVFALRFNVMGNINAAEQWFNMSHATTFDEFKETLLTQSVPLFNIVYADAENNVAYFFNGKLPVRSPSYNWQKTLLGNTSSTLWDKFIPFNDLPRTINPLCGCVFNTNNTPWRNAFDVQNMDSAKFITSAAWHYTSSNIQEHHLRKLINAKEKHSFEDFKAIKFDNTYPQWENGIKKCLRAVKQLDITKYPDIKDAIEVINNWDFVSNVENRNMAMVLYTLARIEDLTHAIYNEMETGFMLTEAQLVQCIKESKKDLLKTFNTITPPLGHVQVIKRSNSNYELPMPGDPYQISPSYCKKIEKGKYKVDKGDTFTMLVKYNKKTGNVFETQMPFGASNNPNSKHYNDQMKMYSTHKTKKMSLNKLDIIPVAEQIYSPK